MGGMDLDFLLLGNAAMECEKLAASMREGRAATMGSNRVRTHCVA